MNNFDRYDQAMRTDPLEAAALALTFASGCGSKANCWNWADRAISAAKQAGVTLDPGRASWPDLPGMTDQLTASQVTP